jgi:hypothetical protein
MRLVFVGSKVAPGEWDVDLVAAYMPMRHGRSNSDVAAIDRAWRVLRRHCAMLQQAGRLLLLTGDLNAEDEEGLSQRKDGRGERSTAADVAFQGLLNSMAVQRLSPVSSSGQTETWTGAGVGGAQGTVRHTSIIDHVVVGAGMTQQVLRYALIDGPERVLSKGKLGHMAVVVILDSGKETGTGAAVFEQRPIAQRMCGAGEDGAVCRGLFAEHASIDWRSTEQASPPDAIWAAEEMERLQTSLMASMEKAVAGIQTGDREGVQMMARGKMWRQALAAQGGGRQLSANTGGSQRERADKAATARATLAARLKVVTERPTTIAAWRAYVPSRLHLTRGMPNAYRHFGPNTDVAVRMRRIYSNGLQHSMLDNGDSSVATATDAERAGLLSDEDVRGNWRNGAGDRDASPESVITFSELLLARVRWMAERASLLELIEALKAIEKVAEDNQATDGWVRRMNAATKNGGAEAVAYSIAAMGVGRTSFGSKSKGGGGTALNVLRAGDVEGGELLFQPLEVRQAAREFAMRMTEARAYNIAGCKLLLSWGGYELSDDNQDAGDAGWTERVFTVEAFDAALRRMRASAMAVGSDGWSGVTLRWAPRELQLLYLRLLKMAMTANALPKNWRTWLVKMIGKKGKDETIFANLRDIWMVPHGWKLATFMMLLHYNTIADKVVPWCASGFRPHMSATDVAVVTTHHAGQASITGSVVARSYVDRAGFFTGIPRAVSFALDSAFGVIPGVTEAFRSIQSMAEGKIDTAFGLTEPFDCTTGVGQGCNAGPVRSLLQLVVTQAALASLVAGFAFEVPRGASKWLVSSLFFADDNNMPSSCAQGIQLSLEVEFCSSLTSGNKVGIDSKGKPTKTACMLMEEADDGCMDYIDGYDIRLPNGEKVPMVTDSYPLLGTPVGGSYINHKAIISFKQRASLAYSMLGRVGGMTVDAWSRLSAAVAIGLCDFYGASTPIGLEAAEHVEKSARSGLFGLGARGKTSPRVQVYSPLLWGGMGRMHTYAQSGTAVAVQIDRALSARQGEPHRFAAESEIALTAHRLGCVPTRSSPTPLDCDYSFVYDAGALRWGHMIESWITVLQQARVRTRSTAGGTKGGSPLDATLAAWSTGRAADGGGPSLWLLKETSGTRTPYSKRLVSIGVTHASSTSMAVWGMAKDAGPVSAVH